MADIVIGVRAYCKMLLHAMKYPHRAVNGVFLAEKRKNKEYGSGTVNIVDSVPLFHLCLSLTPMLEVAVMQVEQYCKSQGLVIAGYYQANEHLKDSRIAFLTSMTCSIVAAGKSCNTAFWAAPVLHITDTRKISVIDQEERSLYPKSAKQLSPDFVANRIAERVYENFSDACLVMIDNQKMSLDCDDVAFHLYQCADNKWKLKDKNSVHFEQGHKALGVASALLHSKAYRKLADFDNHLDDISLDWSNQTINEEIERCL